MITVAMAVFICPNIVYPLIITFYLHGSSEMDVSQH